MVFMLSAIILLEPYSISSTGYEQMQLDESFQESVFQLEYGGHLMGVAGFCLDFASISSISPPPSHANPLAGSTECR